jgi:hypothetical protein
MAVASRIANGNTQTAREKQGRSAQSRLPPPGSRDFLDPVVP